MLQNTLDHCLTCAQVNTKKGYACLLQDNGVKVLYLVNFGKCISLSQARTIWIQTSAGPCHGLGRDLSILDGNSPDGRSEIDNGNYPQIWLPLPLGGSDNGPAFTDKLSQLLSKALNIDWKLLFMYHPQSSWKIERINRTLRRF